MRPRDEWLNQEIERARLRADKTWQPDTPATDDPEVRELAALAHSLQTAPPFQVDPEFARSLEQRMLAHHAAQQHQGQFAKRRATFIPRGLRWRFWLETGLAFVTGCLFIITLTWHDWIEIIFNVDPDQGSGLLEWLIVGVLLLLTITLIVLARYEWRRTQFATT